MACRAGHASDAIKPLLSVGSGINCNARTFGGETPFMSAILSEDLEAIELCTQNKFNPFDHNK